MDSLKSVPRLGTQITNYKCLLIHKGSVTTYDHVNSDGSQSVCAMQSY
jgi:hypothetical protein